MKVYLDNAATSRPDENVIELVASCMREDYANGASLHRDGQRAAGRVEYARDICAGAINAAPSEIIFTSGATEADNIAIMGFALANSARGRHIVSTNIEHHAVLNTLSHLETLGFEITLVPCDSDGLVSVCDINAALRPDTILLSVMHINNELGTIQPIHELGELARANGVAFHVDAAQSMGKLAIDVKRDSIDLLSVSAHKFHGAKGVGFLYARRATRLSPVMFGGGQEAHLRSGTTPTALIAGMGQAVENALFDMEKRERKIKDLRDYFISRVLTELPDSLLNGSASLRAAENANFLFPGVSTDALLYSMDMEGVSFSAGSACSAGSVEPSYVISAIGRAGLGASARFSLSKYTTRQDIDYTVEALLRVLSRLRHVGK